MVKIKKAEYILSAAWKSQWPKESFPEMCLSWTFKCRKK